MVLVYITCKNVEEAKKIGKHLLNSHLCVCVNIIPQTFPMYFWPPHSQILEEGQETVLLVKTIRSKLTRIDEEVVRIHSYSTPCILVLPVERINKKYYEWLKGEIR